LEDKTITSGGSPERRAHASEEIKQDDAKQSTHSAAPWGRSEKSRQAAHKHSEHSEKPSLTQDNTHMKQHKRGDTHRRSDSLSQRIDHRLPCKLLFASMRAGIIQS